MHYMSLCSGIEAATVAWHGLGWTPAAFSEIEPFPCSLLAHHYPTVPNLGDMTRYKEWPDAAIDVLVGGTPCQSFSVAGLRKGLDDPRGNLMLTYGAIALRYRPRWLVWENVPGVLSSGGGRDFGAFLGLLAECGYGFAYRVLDAQYWGVAQRRRRVFVVGYLGDWRRAAAVLFDAASVRGDPAPRRKPQQSVASSLGASPASHSSPNVGNGQGNVVALDTYNHSVDEVASTVASSGNYGYGNDAVAQWPADVACTLDTAFGPKYGQNNQHINAGAPLFVPDTIGTMTMKFADGLGAQSVEEGALVLSPAVAYTLRAEGHDASEDGNGRANLVVSIHENHSAVAVALRGREGGGTAELGDDVGFTIRASSGGGDKPHVMAFTASAQANGYAWERDYAPTINAQVPNDTSNIQTGVRLGMQVRRLTPRECERLQGFPDDYTLIPVTKRQPVKGQPPVVKMAADGPRYKALGNSMAVPVMRWIGERIAFVDTL